jgi:cytochrome P450
MERVRTAVGDEAWVVREYAQVRRLLDDDRLGRSHPEPEKAARTGDSALFGGPLGNFETEHADHARMRRLLQPHFSPKRMRALRPRVEALTAELLDDLTSPADLHAAVALPLPILVICELLGVPYADRDEFRAWTTDVGNTKDRATSERGLGRLFAYGQELVARKRAEPGDDVVSRLCAEDLDDAEVAMLSMSLLFAGHETTVVQIGLGALLLLQDPAQWQALAADQTLVPTAVEEILRTGRRGGVGIPRYAREPFTVDDTKIETGDLVLLHTNAANHDPTVYDNPDQLNITRQAAPHLTFGHGTRYCLGAPLARIELQSVFTQLPTRFPTMRLATDPKALKQRENTLTGGLEHLPVTW